MRTKEEIQRQIEGLQNEKTRLPEYNFFNENNWEPIDIKIAILDGSAVYGDYEDEEYQIESAAYAAQEWLDGDSSDEYDEDLFDLI